MDTIFPIFVQFYKKLLEDQAKNSNYPKEQIYIKNVAGYFIVLMTDSFEQSGAQAYKIDANKKTFFEQLQTVLSIQISEYEFEAVLVRSKSVFTKCNSLTHNSWQYGLILVNFFYNLGLDGIVNKENITSEDLIPLKKIDPAASLETVWSVCTIKQMLDKKCY